MADLDFIKDEKLHQTLEDAIEYIYALFEQSKIGEQKQLYKEETYRVIVLYVISAIEAVLLYFYKERGEKIESLEYKFIQLLGKGYEHNERKGMSVIVAVQEKVEKKEHQVGLHELVTFFRDKKLIKKETADDILELNGIRNTFHFNKPRTRDCDLERVEWALKLLVHTIEKAPLTLKK